MKVTFLLSHSPDPRMYRRMTALSKEHSVEVVYWDRCSGVARPYSVPLGVEEHKLSIPAPRGQWIRRIVPLLEFRRKALGILKHVKPDVIHCGNLDMLLVAHSYRRLLDRDVRLVYEIADLYDVVYNTDPGLRSRILRAFFQALERHLAKEISLLIVTSPYFWHAHYRAFVPKENVLFLPNAPELSLFSRYEKQVHGSLTIGFIGLIRYPHQMRMLVDATDDIEGVRVLFAGSGISYEEIRDYCTGKRHVLFCGPYDYQKDIVNLYSQIDCVYAVYDTSSDNVRIALPNKLYEAIACELPIIVAKNTALAQFVTEHRIGFAVSDVDAQDLRNLLARLVAHPELLEETIEQLRELKPLYSAEAGYDMLMQSYGRLGNLKY